MIWVILLVVFSIVDATMTAIALNRGGFQEVNPLVRFAYRLGIEMYIIYSVLSVLAILVIFWLVSKAIDRQAIEMLIAVDVGYFLVVVWNTISLIRGWKRDDK